MKYIIAYDAKAAWKHAVKIHEGKSTYQHIVKPEQLEGVNIKDVVALPTANKAIQKAYAKILSMNPDYVEPQVYDLYCFRCREIRNDEVGKRCGKCKARISQINTKGEG